MKTAEKFLYSKEDMKNPDFVPNWVIEEFHTFDQIVSDKTFPCTFGLAAHKRGELRYSYISQDDWSQLPKALEEFLTLFDKTDRLIRYGFFLFIEPEKEGKSLSYYRDYFWNVLNYLHEQDQADWPEQIPKDPDHAMWNFSFAGEPFFVFGNTPAYKQRKTRNLGKSLIMGFQPRRIFNGIEGTTEEGKKARETIRKRVEKWDQLPKHPNINHYGDPEHREWKQYFIGDDIKPIKGKCPFSHKVK
ncbi:YqcI/YcgG family protein [Pseudogracilibacillus sp. SE30717A]|uniref:YqcI/YcgG family protein n=1 Tax=Pseudogracilibacillus sp. SE30717A TaxID=3098293 RepID=UPI00300DD162